ncbi:MAG: tRNA pseudouridine(38-40) synthase TruA [Acholeplasma sp.]|nr:tRNA pseudouridine(38-40) synthase TruA [Acholeplasma sp.]
MYRYLCTVSYDGSNYAGFQRQINAVGIQNEIEKALKNMTMREVTIHAAGRTDRGVHALGQVFHFDLDFKIEDFGAWLKGINKRLPDDIILKKIKIVNNNFHARHNAKGRVYEYRIAKKESNILKQRYEVYVENFDVNLVKDILDDFIGIRDYSGFSKLAKEKSPIKILYSIELKETKDQYIFIFHGESFLRNMVRAIMGLIIEIGTKKKNREIIKEVFATKNRQLAGKTAEAKGLFFKKVIY